MFLLTCYMIIDTGSNFKCSIFIGLCANNPSEFDYYLDLNIGLCKLSVFRTISYA